MFSQYSSKEYSDRLTLLINSKLKDLTSLIFDYLYYIYWTNNKEISPLMECKGGVETWFHGYLNNFRQKINGRLEIEVAFCGFNDQIWNEWKDEEFFSKSKYTAPLNTKLPNPFMIKIGCVIERHDIICADSLGKKTIALVRNYEHNSNPNRVAVTIYTQDTPQLVKDVNVFWNIKEFYHKVNGICGHCNLNWQTIRNV